MDIIRMTDRSLYGVDKQTKQRQVFLLGLEPQEARHVVQALQNHSALKTIHSKLVDDSNSSEGGSVLWATRILAGLPYLVVLVLLIGLISDIQRFAHYYR